MNQEKSGSKESVPTGSALRWALLAAAVLGLFAAWFFLPVGSWIESFTSWVEELGFLGGALFAALYAVASVLLVPGAILTLAAGLAFGLWGFPVVVVGATLGAILAFLVSRYVARAKVEEKLKDDRRFRAIDQAIEDQGWKIVALLRLSPLVPFNLQNYLYGVTKVRLLPYALATFFGIMPGSLMYVYFGAAGRAALTGGDDGGNTTLKWTFFAVGLAATIVATVLVTRTAKKKLDDIGVAEKNDG